MTDGSPKTEAFGDCAFCGHTYFGQPNQCRRCGALLNEAVGDTQRLISSGRQRARAQKALSDTAFLVSLLLGGPIMTLGGNVRIGLFIVLAGAITSVIRRYSDWSTPDTVIAGSAFALIGATWLIDPAGDSTDGTLATEEARMAYVGALSEKQDGLFAEARGVGSITVWFIVPEGLTGECGDFPPAEIRDHLAALGFLRVVVADPYQSGGLCSFKL